MDEVRVFEDGWKIVKLTSIRAWDETARKFSEFMESLQYVLWVSSRTFIWTIGGSGNGGNLHRY